MGDVKIERVILPTRGNETEWDIEVKDGVIRSIRSSDQQHTDSDTRGSLLLPAMCHPHIHLDKPYVLTCNHGSSKQFPDYSDLAPTCGSFSEALANTSEAKKRYTQDDLYTRGAQLLATSYSQGVTSLRAFVEIDHVTDTLALETAIKLKEEFSHLIEIQICAFAQDPVFSGEFGDVNRRTIQSALSKFAGAIDVLGSTPYVEKSREAATENIEWAITTALDNNLHLDFHLDYNLDDYKTFRPLTYTVLDMLEIHQWTDRAEKWKTIVLGHCTQLSTLPDVMLRDLSRKIKASGLPLHFVGLPTSDLYMMGRPGSEETSTEPHTRPRGTLQVPSLIKDYGISACISVNNVGNAFTPFGTGDPLQLASWGVGIYQAGTLADAKRLYSCISWGARSAIGLGANQQQGDIAEGDKWQSMLLIKNEQYMSLPAKLDKEEMAIKARPRIDLKDIVWDPPEIRLRSIVG